MINKVERCIYCIIGTSVIRILYISRVLWEHVCTHVRLARAQIQPARVAPKAYWIWLGICRERNILRLDAVKVLVVGGNKILRVTQATIFAAKDRNIPIFACKRRPHGFLNHVFRLTSGKMLVCVTILSSA